MTIKQFLHRVLITSKIFKLDLKVQIGNCCVDIDTIDIEDDMVVINVLSDCPLFILPLFSESSQKKM